MPAPKSPHLHTSSPQSTRLPRKVLRRFIEINRLVPGSRVLLVGADEDGLTRQLADLGMDAMTVDSMDQFEEADVQLVVDCICNFTNEDLTTQPQWTKTAAMLTRVRANGTLCFVFNHAPSLTVTSLHRHLVPFAEPVDKPTGRDTEQIKVEIVTKALFSRDPAWCLASLRVPSVSPTAAEWRQRAAEATTVIASDRAAA